MVSISTTGAYLNKFDTLTYGEISSVMTPKIGNDDAVVTLHNFSHKASLFAGRNLPKLYPSK